MQNFEYIIMMFPIPPERRHACSANNPIQAKRRLVTELSQKNI